MQPSHLRADQPFDMPAEPRRAWWPPTNGDACVVTVAFESAAAEIRTVIDMNFFGFIRPLNNPG
jgi:hypothetical protein